MKENSPQLTLTDLAVMIAQDSLKITGANPGRIQNIIDQLRNPKFSYYILEQHFLPARRKELAQAGLHFIPQPGENTQTICHVLIAEFQSFLDLPTDEQAGYLAKIGA